MMHKNSVLDWIGYVLVIVGALNWGLVGAFNFNLVNAILGSLPTVERVVYILVGIAAIYVAATCTSKCKTSTPSGSAM